MPKKINPGMPEEFPKTPGVPEVEPHPVPEQTPLPGENPLKVPEEVPQPDIPEEQPDKIRES